VIVPYHIHTILTDNGIQFTNRAKDKWAFMHLFDRICYQNGIEHRLTKVNHPWTRRASRADEPYDQRCDRQALLLRNA
jgi:transposase InsO family protein